MKSDNPKKTKSFSERLKSARIERGYTQREIARYAGITERNYISYESGVRKPSFDTAIKIVLVLKVSLDYLAGLSEIYDLSEDAIENFKQSEREWYEDQFHSDY